ncbi:MAG: hypothetical protein IPP48_03465 [Chitinophagaceae bacterium]|nr:hypothetical protein [Chitinophagaceae bacterium]
MGTPEDFNYSELTTLLELQNVWLPGDIKEKYVDAVYEAANFDIDGYGINKEKGWRKLSSVYANSAGAVTVNKKDGDTEFGIVGNNGGTKTNTLLPANLPSLPNTQGIVKIDGVDTFTSGDSSAGEFNNKTMQAWPGTSTPVNNLQPYFVVLKLIKL